jgi:hypothetical protein
VTDNTDKLSELRSERASLASTLTRENVADNVDAWLEAARAQNGGSALLVLNGGQAHGEHLNSVLAEQALADKGLRGRPSIRSSPRASARSAPARRPRD